MPAKTTRKVIHYLRCINDNTPVDLEALAAQARKTKSTVAKSEIQLGQGDIVRIQHYKLEKNIGIFLHLARYVPGERAPTLQPAAAAPEDNEGVQAAPAGKEFKDGDSFLLIAKHHTLYCGHGISIYKTAAYLSALFKEAGIDRDARQFALSPASRLDKLKLMQEHGVKSILLETNAFDISLPKQQRQNWIARAFGGVADEITALLEKDDAIAAQKAKEDLLVNIEVRLDGNTRAVASAQHFIEKMAESVLDDEDAPISEFSIRTQSNEQIRSSDIRLQTSINVPLKDQSVTHTSVWDGLENYLGTLRFSKLLEQ